MRLCVRVLTYRTPQYGATPSVPSGSCKHGRAGGGLVSGLAGAVRGLLNSRFVNTDDPSMSQWLGRYRMAL